jgi:hypothetical protein
LIKSRWTQQDGRAAEKDGCAWPSVNNNSKTGIAKSTPQPLYKDTRLVLGFGKKRYKDVMARSEATRQSQVRAGLIKPASALARSHNPFAWNVEISG